MDPVGQGLLTAARGGALALALAAAGCSHGLFSDVDYPDERRPVAMIETRGGVEFGATTNKGILFLGRTATEGPCRVHYYLGPQPTPLVDDGEIRAYGGIYYLADIDLKHQHANLLERDPTAEDPLVAVVWAGPDTITVPVPLARGEGIAGDLLEPPPRRLPIGTPIFVDDEYGYLFVGLVAGEIELEDGGAVKRYAAFTGVNRMRELLATPRVHPEAPTVKHRPDDITVVK